MREAERRQYETRLTAIDLSQARNDDFFTGDDMREIERDRTSDDELTFIIFYIGVCVFLVLAMASLLDPYAVIIALGMAIGVGATVWVTTSLADIFSEYTNSSD